MAKRVIAVDDFENLQLVANPTLSPDGKWVVYEETTVQRTADGAVKEDKTYVTHLILANIEGTVRRALTSSGTRNTGAVWSPDGKTLAFVSNRAFGNQAWLLPTEGGEARQLTRFRYGISSLAWSPDGSKLFGLTPVSRGKAVEFFGADVLAKEAKDDTDKENKEWQNGPKRYDWMYYKGDGSGLLKGRKSQIVEIEISSGEFVQLTSGNFGVGAPTASPDGKYVAFTSNREEKYEVLPPRSDIYRVPVGGGELQKLMSDTIAYSLSYSPDGKTIAFFGNRNEFESATHTALYTVPADGGSSTKLSDDFPDTLSHVVLSDVRADTAGNAPVWSKNGQSIYALSSAEGRCEVIRFTQSGDSVTADVVIGGDRDIFGFDCDGEESFVIAYGTQTHPGKIASVRLDASQTRKRPTRQVTEEMGKEPIAFFPAEIRLDNASDAFLEEVIVVEPEPFWYRSADDWEVQGWVMKPAEFEAGRKYPVILEVHGGPQMLYGHGMFHEMQWFAAQGYAIVFVNPRGSMGYGQEFVNAVRLHYGENDAADVMNGLDAALDKFDFLDKSRVAVTGGSYGGFMTNWLVGHTDQFFAAVSQRSISNWISFYGVSDIGPRFVESQLGGDVVNDLEKLWRMSPLAYVQNVKTPLLLVHSEHDDRCPIEQAEQFYVNLKRLGQEAELFRIPNASHGLSRNGQPRLRTERLRAIFDWINDRLPG